MITIAKARQLRRLIEKASVSLSDEDALSGIELYPAWEPDTAYETGERIRDDGILYRCEQAHTSQADWHPADTPALWTVVSLDEYPEWVQPTGVQDAYPLGAKVTHNEKHWVSLVDSNVWEPGAVGTEMLWEEQT